MAWLDRLSQRVWDGLAPYSSTPPWASETQVRAGVRGFVRFFVLDGMAWVLLVAGSYLATRPGLPGPASTAIGIASFAGAIGLLAVGILAVLVPIGRDVAWRRAHKSEFLLRSGVRWVPGDRAGPAVQTALMISPFAWIAIAAAVGPRFPVPEPASLGVVLALTVAGLAMLSVVPCVRRLGICPLGLLLQVGFFPTLLLPWEMVSGIDRTSVRVPWSELLGPIRLTEAQGRAVCGPDGNRTVRPVGS